MTLTGLVAALDAVLAVLANKFFEDGPWVPIVILLGVAFVLFTILKDRAENGGAALDQAWIRRILAGRIFIALAAATVATVLTLAVTGAFHRDKAPAAAPAAPAASAGTVVCDYELGEPGVVEVRAGAAAPGDLVICPALLNNGAPLTGPFTVAGRFGGTAEDYRDLVVVGRADPKVCDVYGNRPDSGYYYQSSLRIALDGRWSFRDSVGYAEAVTLARDFQFVAGPPEVLATIRSDRTSYSEKHNGDDGYTGMAALPPDARILATFRQPPGTYQGKGPAPCKAE